MNNTGFYRAFEEIFRGPRERIKARLVFYKPYLEAIHSIYPHSSALDLGCGRGEWLEVLREAGFSPLGIDMDAGMLAACLDLDLPAQQGNALEYIKGQPPASQSLVSAFHLVEHVPFDKLLELIGDIKRSLKPGGLVILETPNPENLRVGAHTFHLDPTHIKPIPPDLLAFLCQYHGFSRVKILRLQTSSHILNGATPTLMDVLTEVSPDYAVVAQSDAPPDILCVLDATWKQDFGVNLGTLAIRYQNHQDNRATQLAEADQTLREEVNATLQKLGTRFEDQTHAQRARFEDEIRRLRADMEGKVYRNLHVPWHTHLYRAFVTLFIKAQKPWHTHVYRAWHSLLNDSRYRPLPPPAPAPLPALAKPRRTPDSGEPQSPADLGLIVRPPDIDARQLESAIQDRLRKSG